MLSRESLGAEGGERDYMLGLKNGIFRLDMLTRVEEPLVLSEVEEYCFFFLEGGGGGEGGWSFLVLESSHFGGGGG